MEWVLKALGHQFCFQILDNNFLEFFKECYWGLNVGFHER